MDVDKVIEKFTATSHEDFKMSRQLSVTAYTLPKGSETFQHVMKEMQMEAEAGNQHAKTERSDICLNRKTSPPVRSSNDTQEFIKHARHTVMKLQILKRFSSSSRVAPFNEGASPPHQRYSCSDANPTMHLRTAEIATRSLHRASSVGRLSTSSAIDSNPNKNVASPSISKQPTVPPHKGACAPLQRQTSVDANAIMLLRATEPTGHHLQRASSYGRLSTSSVINSSPRKIVANPALKPKYPAFTP